MAAMRMLKYDMIVHGYSYQYHLIVAGDCCYYYRSFPSNLTCNPQGQPSAVVLGCGIFRPNGSDVTVRWYRSTQEHLARVQGELVTNGYNEDNDIGGLLSFRGLFFSFHNRIIENFNESLNGFYWCQIEVNNTCLQPSPYGHVIFNSSSKRNCSSVNTVTHSLAQPLCANRTCLIVMTGNTLTPSMEPLTSISEMSAKTPTVSHSDGKSPSIDTSILDIVIGAPVGVVVVCILLVVLLVVIILCLMKEKKMDHIVHSATSEYEIQNTE